MDLLWFTEISSDRPLGEIVDSEELYRSFDDPRIEAPTSLAGLFQQGMSCREIVIRSAGLKTDDKFLRFPEDAPLPVSRQLPSDAYILVCNDAGGPSGCSHQTKQFPRAPWIAMLLRLTDLGYEIVETGLRKTTEFTHPRYRSLAGETSFLEWLGLIRGAAAVVTIEGGTAHLAAVLGRPCVVPCGPTSASAYGHKMHTYVASPICSPCQWRQRTWYEECVEGLGQACMYGHDVDAIVQAVRSQLGIS